MEPSKQLIPFSLLGDADPVPPSFFVSEPEQARALTLLYEVSHELTSTLDRAELLRLIAQRVKKFVNYDVFTVMLWNESAQVLESVFSMRYENAIAGKTGNATEPGHHGRGSSGKTHHPGQ